MALRKGLVELVYGPVLRQSESGVTEPLLSSVLVVSRIPDVSLGHDGLCFIAPKSFFRGARHTSRGMPSYALGSLSTCAIQVSVSVLLPALKGLVVLRRLRREHRHG